MTETILSPRATRLKDRFTLRQVWGALHPAEARALRRAGLFHRLVQFWVRPLGSAGTATDAATRLEILSRGGFPR
jgi:hypothetical protein